MDNRIKDLLGKKSVEVEQTNFVPKNAKASEAIEEIKPEEMKLKEVDKEARLKSVEFENSEEENKRKLKSVEFEDSEEENKKKLKSVEFENESDTNKSPEQKLNEENKGHDEEKKGAFILWGLIVCAVVLSAPLGGGFGFLLAPAQAASFGLIPFWKRKKENEWVIDELSQPGDKAIFAKDGEDSLVTLKDNTDKLVKAAKENGCGEEIDNLSNKLNKLINDKNIGNKISEAMKKANIAEKARQLSPDGLENKEAAANELIDAFGNVLKQFIDDPQFFEVSKDIQDILGGLNDPNLKEEIIQNIKQNAERENPQNKLFNSGLGEIFEQKAQHPTQIAGTTKDTGKTR